MTNTNSMIYKSFSTVWSRYFKTVLDEVATRKELMNSAEIKRAKSWKMPTYSCGCWIRNSHTEEKKFFKAYTFSSFDDAKDFEDQTHGLRKHVFSIEVVSIGMRKLEKLKTETARR